MKRVVAVGAVTTKFFVMALQLVVCVGRFEHQKKPSNLRLMK